MGVRPVLLGLILLILAGCATLVRQSILNERYGQPVSTRFDSPHTDATGDFKEKILPLLERRCVVCHACYDAPCQLKLSSWEGLARGASKDVVYEGRRIREASPTRLFIDADAPSAWRKKGFFPVLNERGQDTQANLQVSPLYRMLDLKQRNPLATSGVLPSSFDFSLDREQQCPAIEEFNGFEKDHAQWGMPYGLPGLTDKEFSTLTEWLAKGAATEPAPSLPGEVDAQVRRWEAFLNQDSRKGQLVSRYLFEHLFMAHLHFDSDTDHHYFRLVRSFTPPGEPVKVLPARRPYEDPGVARIYYRLVPERETLVDKTFMPFALGDKRMARWEALFFTPAYEVDALPAYTQEIASNPFVVFKAIPPDSRYRFMIDEAEFFIMGFIKGPVCRGQVALNVIEDHFWVFFFASANEDSPDDLAELVNEETRLLQLPAAEGSPTLVLGPWHRYANLETEYLQKKRNVLTKKIGSPDNVNLNMVWDGDGDNPNAALTVFRHFDNASVVKGLIGAPPKNAWIIGYPLLERIHYLLVAGYDVYGNLGHQLMTRMYMDFLRMEGEFNFLILVPQDERPALRDYWYREADPSVKDYVYGRNARLDLDSGITFLTDQPLQELYSMLKRRMAPVLPRHYQLENIEDPTLRAQIEALGEISGRSLSWLPELSMLQVEDTWGEAQYFTLLRNTGRLNVSTILRESRTLIPEENTLTVVPGFLGAYPNAFYRVKQGDLGAFADAIRQFSSEEDYGVFSEKFAIRRTNPEFWAFSDQIQAAHLRQKPLEAGLFDYNRLENR